MFTDVGFPIMFLKTFNDAQLSEGGNKKKKEIKHLRLWSTGRRKNFLYTTSAPDIQTPRDRLPVTLTR